MESEISCVPHRETESAGKQLARPGKLMKKVQEKILENPKKKD
jgi:hypothetical protein